MNFFDKKIFTLDKTAKTLLSLFMAEAKRALGEISSQYSDKSPIDFSSAPAESVQLLDCYLTELLLVLKRGGDDNSSMVKRSESARVLAESSIVNLMISYIDKEIYSNITLSDICKRFFMGKSQVCKIFGIHIGKGPIEYYNERKMAEAKKLLREDKTVSYVSDVLGYSSIHNFSRAFKKYAGISPSEYRKKINKQG
jgi:AraC-like DNA-binding protein